MNYRNMSTQELCREAERLILVKTHDEVSVEIDVELLERMHEKLFDMMWYLGEQVSR